MLRSVVTTSPFLAPDVSAEAASPRAAFDALLAFFQGARGPGDRPVTFLFDEVLEFRTFENFPGLRHVLRDLVEGLSQSTNRFVLTTRYVTRALRFFRDQSAPIEIIALTPLSADEVRAVVPASRRRPIRICCAPSTRSATGTPATRRPSARPWPIWAAPIRSAPWRRCWRRRPRSPAR